MSQYDNLSGTGGAHRANAREDVIHGSQDTYVKGEVSSIGALIGDIAGDLSTLMRQEVALAKAEAKESATRAGKGAGLLGGAGAAASYALLFLSIALWWAIGDAIDSLGWSAVIVAVLWGIIAAVLATVGRKQLKDVNGMSRTVDSAKQVPTALKGNEDRA
ncbi:phage holin family protein [Pedococcus sp. 5OH_020]|uniref:phage holin family protein n=1 Tax=Pedococcus sp. 5OH_020 TaxID=2989814 RepID=UPI0022E9BDCC|nr:phage holin family protein [Pedococcus sp. 5OH_020]